MAKAKEEKAPEADAPEKGGKKKMIIIIAASAVIVLLAAGLVFKMLLGPKEAPKDPAKENGAVVALTDDLTLNLSDGKYLKMKMALQLSEKATAAAGGEKGLKAFDTSLARNSALMILGHFKYDELLKPENREKAQADISKEVNERYEGKVLKVYFTDFVMQ